MKCPFCESEQTYCVDSRQTGAVRRRKYRCKSCGDHFRTVERVAPAEQKAEDGKDYGRSQ